MRLLALVIAIALAGCSSTPAPAPAPSTVDAGETILAGQTALRAKRFGTGTTAVILSNMGDNDPQAWEKFAPVLAGQGVTVYTYKFRHDNFRRETVADTIIDLIAVAGHARKQGATKVILIGASLGGMASIKAAAPVGANAIVVIASPWDIPPFEYAVTTQELAVKCPKLFVTGESDPTVPLASTRRLFDAAAEPKQWQSYPDTAHGVQMLAGANGDALRKRLSDFVGSV